MEAGDSFFDEHLSDYSDDFEEDESTVKVSNHQQQQTRAPPPLDFQSTPTPRHAKQDSSFSARANKTDPVFRKTRSQYLSGTIKRSSLNRNSVRGKGRAASEIKRPVKQSLMFSPRDRELSAKRHAIKKLENSLMETKRELSDLKKENRLLNRLQIRQEKELNRFQTQEGELPEILARHAEEVRALKEQLKRSQEASHSHQQKANDLHHELLRVNNRKKRLEEVAKRKHLLEREKLTLQLQDINEELKRKERRIAELERGIEAMNKNHNQEVRSLMLKNRALSNEAEDLRNASERLHAQLKEKEREMDVLNIYSQRLGKNMPPRLATRLQAPETDNCASQTELTCPPSKNVSLQTKLRLKTSASQTDLPSPKPEPPPSKEILSLAVATQTADIAASPKNDNLGVSNAPVTGGSGPLQLQQPQQQQQQQPVSKPETAVTAPSGGGLSVMAQSPPASKPSPRKESLSSELEEQKKRELLATLKAMDAQKDPPASQPIASTATKSTAQPTSNVLVGGERPTVTGKMTKQATQLPTTSQLAKIDSDEEAKKKKLLLAKLMAIDEGSDPNKVTISKMDVSKVQPPPTKHPASGRQSTTSIQSWPETVENMYQGKPAFATDDDPFGSRHTSGKKGTSTKSRDFFLTEGGGEVGESSSSSSTPKNRRLGRRHQLEQKQLSTLDFSADNSSVKADSNHGGSKVATKAAEQEGLPVEPTTQLGYQPTFGRRAGAAQATKQKPKNGMIFGDFDSFEPSVAAKKKTEPPSSLDFEGSESKPKAAATGRDYPWETRVNVSSNTQGTTERERPRGGEKERRESVKSNDGGFLSSPGMVFGYVGQEKPLHALQSRSRGSLLPLREKAGLGSVMPGTQDITEPDDLEELAL